MKKIFSPLIIAIIALLPLHAHAGLKAVSSGSASVTGAGLDNATGASTTGGQWLNRTGTGAWTAQPEYQVLGACYLLDYDPAFASKSESNQGTSFENWLLDCQSKAITLGAANQANITMPSCIRASTMGLSEFALKLNTLEVIPRYVCADFSVTFGRDGSSGTPIANWNGDPTTKQLSNLYQPMFILPPNGIISGILRVNANSNGSDRGSGLFYGRTWRMASLTVQATGSGFVGGETCTVANGDSKAPAAGATFTVATASGGAVTGITFAPTQWQSITGQYYLPPYLQRQQWAVANGWNGSDSLKPQVFDNDVNKYYKTTCSGSGTGLTVSAKFWPDWCSGSAADSDTVSCSTNTSGPNSQNAYDGIFGNYSASPGFINQAYIEQSGNSHDATYGYTYGAMMDAAELTVNYIQTQGSHYGEIVYGSDFVQFHHNDVDSAVQLKLRGGGSLHVLEAREDTPVDALNSDAHALEIDKCGNCDVNGEFFHNSSSAADVGTPYLRLGSDAGASDATHESAGVIVRGILYSTGTSGASLAALGCAYTSGATFDLNVSNLTAAHGANAQQFTKFVNFGSNCEVGNEFRGRIDNQTDPIYSGTFPQGSNFHPVNGKTGATEMACETIAQGGAKVENTAISTSEVNLVSIPLPPMGPNERIEADVQFEQGTHAGNTSTDTHNMFVRLGTAGCTSLSTCSSGTAMINVNFNSSSLIAGRILSAVQNQGATNAQVSYNVLSSSGTGASSAVSAVAAIQTNTAPFINIDCATATSTADSCAVQSYSIKRCNGGT